MSKFVVATFPDVAMASEANKSLDELRAMGTTVYGWAVLGKDANGRISVLHRVTDSSRAAAVAALIGALAGLPAGLLVAGPDVQVALPAGLLGAALGAVGGGLVGITADLTDRGVGRELAEKVSHALAAGSGAVIADIAPQGMPAFGARMKAVGGTILHAG